ncbi:MAG: CdaR family protein, partial [Pyrinomonadaceae bacterium]
MRETKRGAMGDARSVLGPWLHALLFEDWWLKLLSLLLTLGLWYAVTGQRAPATVRLRGVQLEFVRPQDVDISNDPVEDVDVTLEGSQGKLAEVNARNIVARANITGLRPGDRVARLTPENVSMDLPADVQIVRIEPGSVALHLEPILEREIEVEARFEGAPPAGYERGSVQITPGRVRVRGPESHVNSIEKAHTETISLAGQRESITLPQVAIDIS